MTGGKREKNEKGVTERGREDETQRERWGERERQRCINTVLVLGRMCDQYLLPTDTSTSTCPQSVLMQPHR